VSDATSGSDTAQRRRLLALLAVLALLAGALALGLRDDVPDGAGGPVPNDPDAAELVGLRADAALAPCPAALSPELPELELACLGGGDDVAVASAAPDRPTLVNVWGSWCAPCVREVPLLADFAARAGDRVGLVGVLTQDSLRSALTFAAESGMRWPSVVDDGGAVMRAYSPAPPVTLFVAADGRVVHVERGEFTDVAEIEALVAQHLGVQL
jgi:thiol-disulfide isomerase/thioredoxin